MILARTIPLELEWAWAVAGISALACAILWTLLVMWPWIRWSRRMMLRSFEQGHEVARILADVRQGIEPMVVDLKAMVQGIRREDVERFVHALEDIPRKIDELAKKAERGAVDGFIDKL